jgi:hypothetical protein
MKNTYHRDGTVTYWAVFTQAWEVRANHVPVREMAAMNPHERKRIERHFSKRSDDETSHYRCES